jgi:uncharacterized membrane protein SpoIIM required for sporulation
MTEQSFIQRRGHIWNEFAVLVIGKGRRLAKGSLKFLKLFREITQDLNTAKANGFDPAIIERLNTLVNEGNQILYSRRGWSAKTLIRFLIKTFPQKVRSHWKGIMAVTLLFYGLAFFFGLLCFRFPGISEELVSASELKEYEKMYDPESANFLQPRDVSGDADMFGFYIFNNISIAFRTFAGGILAGFGSLLILCINGVKSGIIEGHLIQIGFAKTLIPFVIAHSALELTAIVFSAYSGMFMGYRFFVTNGLSRGASIKKAGQDALPIIAGSALMLFIAAAIEAFWSSRHTLPFKLRIGAGIVVWILVLSYFLFAGRAAKGKNNEHSV